MLQGTDFHRVDTDLLFIAEYYNRTMGFVWDASFSNVRNNYSVPVFKLLNNGVLRDKVLKWCCMCLRIS